MEFVSMQNMHNLIYRAEEKEMINCCNTTRVGVVPWGPLAPRILCTPMPQLMSTDRGQGNKDKMTPEVDAKIIKQVEKLATKKR